MQQGSAPTTAPVSSAAARFLGTAASRAPSGQCVKYPAPPPHQSQGPDHLHRCRKAEEEPELLVGCVYVCVPQSKEKPERGGSGQVGVVRRRGEWRAGGALPQAAVAGKGGSSGGGEAGQASLPPTPPPPEPLGWQEGVTYELSLGEYVCSILR